MPRALSGGAGFERGLNLDGLAFTLNLELELVADLLGAERLDELRVELDRLAVGLLDDVADLQAGLVARAVRDDLAERRAGRLGAFAADAEIRLVRRIGRFRARPAADLLGLNDRENGLRVFLVIVDPDPAKLHRRQAGRQLLPGLAAVGRLVEPAAGPELLDRVAGVVQIALPLVGSGDQGFRVGRADPQIDDAGLVIDIQDLVPGLAAVGRLEQPALGAGAVEPAEHADVGRVRVFGMDGDLADLIRVLEAHVLPRLTAVDRLVDAVAVRNRVPRVRLAGADPDDVGVRRGDRHVADRDGRFFVKLMFECQTVVHRLEQSAPGRGDPVGTRVVLDDRQGRDPPPHVRRPERSPGQGLDPLGTKRWKDGVRLGVSFSDGVALLGQIVDLLLNLVDLRLRLGRGGRLAPRRAVESGQPKDGQQCRQPGQSPRVSAGDSGRRRDHGWSSFDAKLWEEGRMKKEDGSKSQGMRN